MIVVLAGVVTALQQNDRSSGCCVQSRRNFITKPSGAAASILLLSSTTATTTIGSLPSHAAAPTLDFRTSTSGITYADAKEGTGPTPKAGSVVSIDYSLSTTGARYGAKIYGTSDRGSPYRWKLGDGSTIAGIEEAILGSEGMPPMRAGGIRRVILPESLAYSSLGKSTSCEGAGPVPPKDLDADSFGAFQRFKNIYCNPNRQYQPDVVMDIKLYGPRS